MPTFSFIITSTGRESLIKTLESIPASHSDEALVVSANAWALSEAKRRGMFAITMAKPGHDWGHTERNIGLELASKDYISFMDDDDEYTWHAGQALATVSGPTIFRMQYASGQILWDRQELAMGNVGTPMMVIPNRQGYVGKFGRRYEGDFDFLMTCRWPNHEWDWRGEVIAKIRPNAS